MATIRKLRGRWQAQVRRKGLAPRARSFDTKADAEKWARKLESEVDRVGILPNTRAAESTTLKDVLLRYRDSVSPSKRSSVSEIARINALMTRDISFRTLAMLSSSEVARYRDMRLKTVSPATVIRELNLISHAIDTARREWDIHLADNPCKLVRRPAAPKGRTRRLGPEEEQKLLQAADEGRNRYMRPLIVLALETGMRRGELLGLTWENVDLKQRVAHLTLTKNGDSRDVPLSRRAMETLMSLEPKRSGRVLPHSGNAVRLAWEHLVARASLDDLHFHDLRHEAVSRLFEKGLGLMEVAAISGHKELRMLARYTHLRAADLVVKLD